VRPAAPGRRILRPRWSPRHIKWFDVGPRVGSGKRVHLARSTEDAAPTAKVQPISDMHAAAPDGFGPPQVDVCKCIRSLSGAAATVPVSVSRGWKHSSTGLHEWVQPSISVSLRTKCYGFAPRTPLDPGQLFTNHGEPALTLSTPPLKFAELALACAQTPVNLLARGGLHDLLYRPDA
jgi:hypothetical protein